MARTDEPNEELLESPADTKAKAERADKEMNILPQGTPLPSAQRELKKRETMKEGTKESSAAGRFAMITLFVNISLMIAKAVASYLSGSLSIISSLIDSVVDITSGLVISISNRMIRKRDPRYPRGRTRLEPLSLIIISVVMGFASIQLIVDAFRRIFTAYQYDFHGIGEQPKVEMSLPTVIIMVSTVVVKFCLFLVCQKYKNDASIQVLAMDHRNDCISNSVSLLCAWLAQKVCYYADPIGAILVSLYILSTWVSNGIDHVRMLSGKTASQEFVNRIVKLCLDHDPRIKHLGKVYAYHFGTKFLVEVYIGLEKEMHLHVVHEIMETLQTNIESLSEVERAFIHPNYNCEHQAIDEHKV